MTTGTDPIRLLADILDPPAWQPAGRPPLEPHQTPPTGDWALWVLAGGRGSGKTEGATRYFAAWMRAHPGHRGRIIGPTLGDVVESCVVGPSGLQAVDPEVRFLPSAPGGAKVVWPNGSEAVLIGTPTPRDVERLRAAGNRHLDWWEEAAANPQLRAAWEQAEFGLRLGTRPHSIASTTPRNTAAYRDLLAQTGTVVTRGTIRDNPHLPASTKARLEARYAGTRLGRQELDGELIEDVDGALWTIEQVSATRVWDDSPAGYSRVVVAVDPAVTSGEGADATGIVVVARGVDGHGYVLRDWTQPGLSPDGWARRVIDAFDTHQADRVVAETNNGGDLVETVLRTVRRGVPFRKVHASRGKRVRAEPVAALYEQGRVHHVGVHRELEDEMTTWTPEDPASPDRMDALVWGVTDLGLVAPAPRRTRLEREGAPRAHTAGMITRGW